MWSLDIVARRSQIRNSKLQTVRKVIFERVAVPVRHPPAGDHVWRTPLFAVVLDLDREVFRRPSQRQDLLLPRDPASRDQRYISPARLHRFAIALEERLAPPALPDPEPDRVEAGRLTDHLLDDFARVLVDVRLARLIWRIRVLWDAQVRLVCHQADLDAPPMRHIDDPVEPLETGCLDLRWRADEGERLARHEVGIEVRRVRHADVPSAVDVEPVQAAARHQIEQGYPVVVVLEPPPIRIG